MFPRLFSCLAAALLAAFPAFAASPKISPALAAQAKRAGYVEVLIQPGDRADLSGLSTWRTQAARGGEAMARLQAVAESRQRGIRAWLDARGIEHRDFWLVNAIQARVPVEALTPLAARSDVVAIVSDAGVRQQQPIENADVTAKATAAVEWGVAKIRAPEVWALGTTGQGVVVAGADTGIQWDHPALKNKYRGWNGSSANHAYAWHDSIHGEISGNGTNLCGYSSPEPCDDDVPGNGHGTHTIGTMVGDDGLGNQIGVAPGARWIGCRNMEDGVGRPSTYIECFQWFVAPTDANGANPMPALAPQVINNSWTCPPGELCDAQSTDLLRQAIEATVASGILVVVSAGNFPGAAPCSSIVDPPAFFDASFAVGATDSNDNIAYFSELGPITIDGSNRLKPDVSAPGVNVRSSHPGNTYANLSGTSMASPHVAGAAALLMSAHPELKGNPAAIASRLRGTAFPRTSLMNCGGFAGTQVPNPVYGYGRIDVFGATDYIFSSQFED